MTYERFEDVRVWQKAAQLYEGTEELLEHHGSVGRAGSEINWIAPRSPFQITSLKASSAAPQTNFSLSFTLRAARRAKFARCFA
jgi:hypothetical protein